MTTFALPCTNALYESNSSTGKIEINEINALLKLKECNPPENKPVVGLDALAVLCSKAASIDEKASEDETPQRRSRSVSNPEGMEKWNALVSYGQRTKFVAPSPIEEESDVFHDGDAKMDETVSDSSNSLSKDFSRTSLSMKDEKKNMDDIIEMLKKARMKILDDLHAGGPNTITLPHALLKYREVYNKNGRIGIYTPAERAAIISRFQFKKSRRVWNKKIRYNCRKNLADRRMRVKGRFVKRSSEEAKKEEAASALAEVAKSSIKVTQITSLSSRSRRSPLNDSKKSTISEDLDTNDIEAGFCNTTAYQPFRRTRRYTIT